MDYYKDVRVGDRFGANDLVIEVLQVEPPIHLVIQSKSNGTHKEGSDSFTWVFGIGEGNMKFLGNFAKANNVKSLYEKLSS